MLGSNTEATVKLIDDIIVALDSLSVSQVSYQITTTGSTSVSGGDSHSHSVWTSEDPHTATIANVSKLKSFKPLFDKAVDKANLVDKNIYVRNTSMHNSIGSPYTEMYRLQDAINNLISYSRTCQYMGEYVEAIAEASRLLNRATQLAVDAKWAVITYGDYLERGYNWVQKQDPDTTQ